MYGEDRTEETENHTTENTSPETSAFEDSVVTGLSQPQKTLPCRWLYDTRGSELFEAITELPEYYPTRTEIGILKANAPAIAEAIGSYACIVEFGAGAGTKTRLFLSALNSPKSYTPIDISADFLEMTMTRLAADYPDIEIVPLVADFTSPSALEEANLPDGNRVGFFPGSTIGNLTDPEIVDFLSGTRKGLGSDAKFVVGIDLVKSADVLIPAYDDAAGITAAFNANILRRINRELDGNFTLDAFRHEARWDSEQSRIEMHLVSKKPQLVRVGRHQFSFESGESIHTENSRKFSHDQFKTLAQQSGWSVTKTWTDENQYFALCLLH